MTPEPTIGIVSSFWKGFNDLIQTCAEFKSVQKRCQTTLILETENIEVPPTIYEQIKKDWSNVLLWSPHTTDKLLDKWQHTSLPIPFRKPFSYGSAVNRLLLGAAVAGCDFVVRLDPGCTQADSITDVVDRHLFELGNGAVVVSGQYTGRSPLRTDLVAPDREESLFSLVERFTGIDARKGRQVTGGAAYCQRVSKGPPALSFDNQRVWGSDDGIQKLLHGHAARVLPTRIGRSEPGIDLPGRRYAERVANSVALFALLQGGDDTQTIRRTIEFQSALVELVPTERKLELSPPPLVDANTVVALREGLDRYEKLKSEWPEIVQVARKRIDLSHLRVP